MRYTLVLPLLLMLFAPASTCPSLGCGCHLAEEIYGKEIPDLYEAKAWLNQGSPAASGCVGCIAILRRGHGGHVGVVRGYNGPNPVIYSWGNRRIGWHTQTYSSHRIIGYRHL